MKIGVFDSGVGGLSVANAIQVALPELDVMVREDSKNLPYGTKTPVQLKALVIPILNELRIAGCQAIVIACNTVTTTLINELREVINVPLIGIEPMVKPASEITKTKIIAVCATPATLQSKRYAWLKQEYGAGVKILEPDCSDWALMVEANRIDHQQIIDRTTEVLDAGADVIVLACTHYHWIETDINDLAAQRATVLQPEQAIIRQLQRVLAQLQ